VADGWAVGPFRGFCFSYNRLRKILGAFVAVRALALALAMAFLCFPFDFLVAVRQWMLLVFLVLQVASRQLLLLRLPSCQEQNKPADTCAFLLFCFSAHFHSLLTAAAFRFLSASGFLSLSPVLRYPFFVLFSIFSWPKRCACMAARQLPPFSMGTSAVTQLSVCACVLVCCGCVCEFKVI